MGRQRLFCRKMTKGLPLLLLYRRRTAPQPHHPWRIGNDHATESRPILDKTLPNRPSQARFPNSYALCRLPPRKALPHPPPVTVNPVTGFSDSKDTGAIALMAHAGNSEGFL